jgi:hypothetical protein
MATVDVKIFKPHKKADGTYNVKIRVTKPISQTPPL